MMYHVSDSHLSSHSTNSERRTRCLCALAQDGFETGTASPDATLRCPACVRRSLKPHIDRHAQALKDHAQARDDCARHLEELPNHNRILGEFQAESQRLRDRLATLRKQCASMAVRVASQAVENDTYREGALAGSNLDQPQVQLAQLEHSLLQGSFHHALDVASRQVRFLRFQWARKALTMHRLDIDPNDIQPTALQQRRQHASTGEPDREEGNTPATAPRSARGIGKIGGLPLPHAGPELYGVLPPRELQSALRLVASVTCTVARCLGIVLPHPILLSPTSSSGTSSEIGDITDTVSDYELERRLRESHHATASRFDDPQLATMQQQPSLYNTPSATSFPSTASASSLYSLMDTSFWKRSAKKALARATGQTTASSPRSTSASNTPTTPSPFVPPSMDSSELSRRIHHATAAVLAEDGSKMSSKFALSTDAMHQEDFAIALQLLQNNVIVLCIRAGVPVTKLFPAEAVLLNLFQLDKYCTEQTAVNM